METKKVLNKTEYFGKKEILKITLKTILLAKCSYEQQRLGQKIDSVMYHNSFVWQLLCLESFMVFKIVILNWDIYRIGIQKCKYKSIYLLGVVIILYQQTVVNSTIHKLKDKYFFIFLITGPTGTPQSKQQQKGWVCKL